MLDAQCSMLPFVTALLFTPYKLRDVAFRNRIGVSPMCQYWSHDGFASEWHLVHLGSRAVGGAALVMTEATAVEGRGRITPYDLGIWSDDHIPMLAKITKFIREFGAVPGIQLAHAGRKSSAQRPWEGGRSIADGDGGWPTVAPSPLAFGGPKNELWKVPAELSVGEISQIQQAFVTAARRALQAGFRLVELHFAHGYLGHSFLSPISNRRADQYGGSFENRVRFALETVQQVREVWPTELPLAMRVSASDWLDGGWDIDQTVQLANLLKPLGIDLLDCSSGGIAPGVKYDARTGYQVPFAEQVQREADLPTAAVGSITNPKVAEEVLQQRKATFIFLARAMLDDPYWPLHASFELDSRNKLAIPPSYEYVLKHPIIDTHN
jgi:2,4-dienoyl-CoA reductase-like NADH-dependent reductase (Old Yellow Enzyme family)